MLLKIKKTLMYLLFLMNIFGIRVPLSNYKTYRLLVAGQKCTVTRFNGS
jgi:hypothetical protein